MEVEMPFGLQPWHLIVIAVAALIVFGPSKLPELGRSIGRSITEFRKGTREMTESFKEELAQDDTSFEDSAPVFSSAATHEPAAQKPLSSPLLTPIPITGGNYCNNCGSPNPAEAKFCNNCGSPIKA
jgi:TatA/E family protein of Tat protein translocase